MRWNKRIIDRMEMLHLLGMIYAQTSVGFGKVTLRKLIREQGKPSVQGKENDIVKALSTSGLLLYEGNGRARRFRWNFKDFGAVSLPIADMMIHETENQVRIRARESQRRRYKRINVDN